MGVSQWTVSSGGVTIEGINIDTGVMDFNGTADCIVLDADGDTTISAPTDDQIDIEIAGNDDFTFTANAFNVLSGSSILGASSNIYACFPAAAQQALSGAGAVTLTEFYTAWTSTSTDAGTLADGNMKGQLKKIQLVSNSGGDATLTPTNLSGGTNITFADVGDFALLMWDGNNWVAVELGNAADGATAPALA
jgi:hypothetical protein